MGKRKNKPHEVAVSPAKKPKALEVPACCICLSELCIPMRMCIANNGLCGETYHEECITRWQATTMRDNFNGSCPKCKQEFIPARNRALEDMFEEQGTSCINKARGCTEVLSLSEMQMHYTRCPYRLMECTASQYRCDWSGLESERAAHEAGCMFALFGQQAIDAQEKVRAAGAETVVRIEQSVNKLTRLKKTTERRIQQYTQLQKTLAVDNATKRVLSQLKTKEYPISVLDVPLRVSIEYEESSRDLRFSVRSAEITRLPVAVCAIAFLMIDADLLIGERQRSAVESFILDKEHKSAEVLRTRLAKNAPSELLLDFKLVIKLFY